MILNLVIIVFILTMAVMWATYGLFSALLHLLVVIVSGALAFAFWELWVDKLFIGMMPTYAWGLGLALPFAVLLIGLRAAMDSLIRGNVQFPRLANQIVGGAFGACSGILTAGVAVIGIGFLPLPYEIGGFRPYEVNSVGDVVRTESGGQLWIKVDQIAADFFNRLSNGAFSTSTPLAYYVPDVAQQSAVNRLAKYYDPNVSLVASPGTVSIKPLEEDGVAVFDEERVPGVGGEVNNYLENQRNRVAGGKLVVVQTDWKKIQDGATYDADSNLRVPPTQVRLSIDPGNNQPWELVAPIGFSRKDDAGRMAFYPLQDTRRFYATSLFPEIQINWVFAVPSNAQPNFLRVRNSRLTWANQPLPTVDGRAFGAMLGAMATPDEEAAEAPPTNNNNRSGGENAINTDPVGYTTHKIASLEQTNNLPAKVSKNKARAFSKSDDEGDAAILSGSQTVEKGSGGRGNSYDRIAVSESRRAVRAVIVPHTPSNDGTPQGNVQEIWLSDTAGNFWRPFAFVLLMADGRQKINVQGSGEFRNNTDLPINEISPGDTLYVYWSVPPGITLDAYHVGTARQEIGYKVQ